MKRRKELVCVEAAALHTPMCWGNRLVRGVFWFESLVVVGFTDALRGSHQERSLLTPDLLFQP